MLSYRAQFISIQANCSKSQPVITGSKLTIKALEQGVKYV